MPEHENALKAAENALRALIELIGLDRCAPRAEDRRRWEQRRAEELRARGGGFAEERLLSYADIEDLKRILLKPGNWPFFEPALGALAEATVLLDLLRRFRNPTAHNRELSTHEQSLLIGISGELRTRITRYMSQQDTPDAYFPRILSFQNNLGAQPSITHTLRVGAEVEFIVEASDPLGQSLEYRFGIEHGGLVEHGEWGPSNRWSWHVTESHVSRSVAAIAFVRSPRTPHALGEFDDNAVHYFAVLPAQL